MLTIKETVVVEGKNDISAVKAAIDCDVIAVGGFAVCDNLDRLRIPYEKNGLIILTDPDYAGNRIRRIITKKYPNAKNAYISQDEGTKKGDIGIENATPEAIIRALTNVRVDKSDNIQKHDVFRLEDMVAYGLTGTPMAAALREKVGIRLGIGYSNTKQFLYKLNRYGLTKQELEEVLIEK